eukprot:2281459-Amphidinium_carterae.1
MELLVSSIQLSDEYFPNVAFHEDEPNVMVVANLPHDDLVYVGGSEVVVLPGFVQRRAQLSLIDDLGYLGGSAVLVLPGLVRHHLPKGVTIATWLEESGLSTMAVLWEGCSLHPDTTLDALVPQEVHVFLLHSSSLEINPPPMIRPYSICKASK